MKMVWVSQKKKKNFSCFLFVSTLSSAKKKCEEQFEVWQSFWECDKFLRVPHSWIMHIKCAKYYQQQMDCHFTDSWAWPCWSLRMLQFALDTGSTHGFPLAVSDGHVAGGLSSAMYEAIITSCWVWLALYKICGEDSYNQRAVSTLCNESFNSDLLRIDKDGTSALKEANIAKILTVVTALLNRVTQATHQYTETWDQLLASPITKKEAWKIPDEKYFSWNNQMHRNPSCCVEALHSMAEHQRLILLQNDMSALHIRWDEQACTKTPK